MKPVLFFFFLFFQYFIRDRVLLVKTSIVIVSVIVLFFVQSFVETLDLGVGKFGAFQKFKVRLRQWQQQQQIAFLSVSKAKQ